MKLISLKFLFFLIIYFSYNAYASKIEIITNVGGFDNRYPLNLRQAMNLSDEVRIYESAKMGMDLVLETKAKLFIKTNGGILWIQ